MSFFSGGSLSGIVMWVVTRVTAVLAVLLAVVALLLGTESGTARLLGWLPGVDVVEPRGALLDDFSAQRVVVALPRESSVRIDELAWQGWSWSWDERLDWRLALGLTRLSARAVRVMWHADPDSPPSPLVWPTSLALPVAARIDEVKVGLIEVNLLGAEPVRELDLSVALQDADTAGKARHVLTVRRAVWHRVELQGHWHMAPTGDMAVASGWRASLPSAGQAALTVSGPLQDLAARLSVDVASQAGRPAQNLLAQARVQGQLPWPLTSLQADARGFDLQAVHEGLPHTALTGQLSLAPRPERVGAPGTQAQADGGDRAARQAPSASPGPRPVADLMFKAVIRNERAGAWDEGRVPVTDLDLDVTLPGQASLDALADLGRRGEARLLARVPSRQPREPGVVSLSGPWDLAHMDRSAVRLSMRGVDLRALHGAAPALRLGGEAAVRGQGIEQWQLTGSLQGQEAGDARLQPVSAELKGQWRKDTFTLQQLTLLSAGARADVNGTWTRQRVGWRAVSALRLQGFDPAVWMPWPRPAGDAAQPTRLQATANLDLRHEGDWARTLATADAQVRDSVLLGVPTQARLQWALQPASAAPGLRGSTASAEVSAAGHAVSAALRWPSNLMPGDAGFIAPGSQLKARLNLKRLADFEPWARALGLSGLQGRLEGDLQWQGDSERVWSSQGRLDAQDIRWDDGQPQGGARLGHAKLGWNAAIGRGAAQPWKVDATLDHAAWRQWGLKDIVARLDGTLRDHRLDARGQVQVPPAPDSAAEPLRAELGLQVTGQWPDPGRGSWKGLIRSAQAAPPGAPAGTAWVMVRDMALTAAQPAATGWQLSAAPGSSEASVQVLGAGLELRKLRWQQGGEAAPSQSELDVRLLPWPVVRTLQQLQPRAGWGGDLMLDGQVSVRQVAGKPWVVDADLKRASGDLNFSDIEVQGGTPQRLGIRDLALELRAREGVWTARQVMRARLMGTVTGEQVIRPLDAAGLPAPTSALQGRLEAEVSNLRSLAAWLPPGWRLSGLLQARAQIQGTVGAPLFNGEVRGTDIGVSNSLEGVNVSGGDMLARLVGDRMTIDRFTAHGGEGGGTLSLTGEAVFDQAPTARLALELRRFAALQRVDRRVRVSGSSELRIDPARLSVRGQFRVDDGLIDIGRSSAPTIGDDVIVINRPGQVNVPIVRKDEGKERRKTPAGREIDVDVRADLGDELRLFGMGLDTRLAGVLRATTPGGRLQVTGVVNTVGGTFAAYGQKLAITRGRVIFTGVMDNPRLDIEATRPRSPLASAQDVTVGVTITGTVSDPRVRLFSEPPMSETDKLSWLVLGRDSAGLAGADLLLLQTAASALLGTDANPATSLAQTFGLDELSVRQSDTGTGDTVVTLGRRISDRWYMGFEQSVNGAEARWQLIYRLAQRITLRVQTGEDTSVDLIWQLLWN